MSERVLSVIAGLLAALVLGLALFWQPEVPERPLPRAAMPEGGDFTLHSAAGPVALGDFRGKVVLSISVIPTVPTSVRLRWRLPPKH
jgi:protein SCO1/2